MVLCRFEGALRTSVAVEFKLGPMQACDGRSCDLFLYIWLGRAEGCLVLLGCNSHLTFASDANPME